MIKKKKESDILYLYRSTAVFVQVAKNRSFSKTAKQLGITTSAVSQSIVGLEKSLGITLFLRSTRSLNLSEEGKKFFDMVRGSVEKIQQAHTTFNQNQRSNKLAIHCSTSLQKGLLQTMLNSWEQGFDDIDLFMSDHKSSGTSLKQCMLLENLDYYIGIFDKSPNESSHTTTVEQALVCSPEIHALLSEKIQEVNSGNRKTSLVLGMPILKDASISNTSNRVRVKVDGNTHTLHFSQTIAMNNLKALVDLAIEKAGVLMAPTAFIEPYLQDGRLVKLNVSLPLLHLSVVKQDNNKPSDLVKKFDDVLNSYLNTFQYVASGKESANEV